MLLDSDTLLLFLSLMHSEAQAASGGHEELVWSDTLALATQMLAALSAGATASMRSALLEAGAMKIIADLLYTVAQGANSKELHNIACSLIRIIGNLAFRHHAAQEEARELGVPQLILGQCAINPDYPYKREWGMLAIRNLCEGNMATQEMLEGLENRGPAPNNQQGVDLEQMGLKVEMDQYGKVRVVNKADGQAAAAPQEGTPMAARLPQ